MRTHVQYSISAHTLITATLTIAHAYNAFTHTAAACGKLTSESDIVV
jgi:hypothetical protein